MDAEHGNPTLLIPRRARGSAPVQVVVVDGDEGPVWESHGLTADVDAVRVDNSHGEFVGRYAGWSVLEAGRYRVVVGGGEGRAPNTDLLSVENRELFSTSFDGPESEWFRPDAPVHTKGAWRSSACGIVSLEGPGYVLVEADMHGVLGARFRTSAAEDDLPFGLIARLYNASHHVRVVVRWRGGRLQVSLVRVAAGSFERRECDTIAVAERDWAPGAQADLLWSFNGTRHVVGLNGDQILDCSEGYMGGVTVVGLFSENPAVVAERFRMTGTQAVPRYRVDYPAYSAVVRPGNVQELYVRGSAAPYKNIFWESGIQFGHIGGSELKFSQSAELLRTRHGPVMSQVRWRGPMPKFVDQSDDVRGWAHGVASFFRQRIVITDFVLAWTDRSVGPDLDMSCSVVREPARIALSGAVTFEELVLPETGEIRTFTKGRAGDVFPVCVAMPLSLDRERWWLTVVIDSLYRCREEDSGSIFAWRCPFGLTVSHDFRFTPTVPGREYAFSIVAQIRGGGASPSVVERELLEMREEWDRPADIHPEVGGIMTAGTSRDQPARAGWFDGCFDRSRGIYCVEAFEGAFFARVDPGPVPRSMLVLEIQGLRRGGLICSLDQRVLSDGTEHMTQWVNKSCLILQLTVPVVSEVTLRVEERH